MLLRYIQLAFMLALACWGLLGAAANLLAYSDGYSSVLFAFSMQGVQSAPALWRAVDNPLVIHLGFGFIWLSKLVMGVLCTVSALQMLQSIGLAAHEYRAAKRLGLAGAYVCMFMLFFGFIVISGTYFELWRDTEVMGYEASVYAFIYFGFLFGSVAVISDESQERNQ